MKVLSGVGAIGITYHSCPYWDREDGRGSLHISLWFIKLIIRLPFQDITEKGHGTYTSSYGAFWWPRVSKIVKFYWESVS